MHALLNLEDDIPLTTAIAAHNGTSFVPEKRGASERTGYAETLRSDYESLAKLADTDEKRSLLDEEFTTYRAGYRKHVLAWLHSRSRIVSTMIAGPSNFPVRQMEKRSNWAHNHLQRLLSFRERALEAIRKKLCPGPRPIMSGDDDAVERLEAKISDAERLQAAMREANKIVRSKPKNQPTPEKITALVALGLKAANAASLFEPDFCGRLGFPDYKLANNNANIKRMKDRLAAISRNKAAEESTVEGEHARVDDCPAENRVRLFFPGKPAAEVRRKLKSSGFRWAPSLGCWQAYRNDRTRATAIDVAGVQPD